MFGRRRKKQEAEASAAEPAAPAASGEAEEADQAGPEDAAEPARSDDVARAGGPWDSAEEAPKQTRIDFGSLRIPVGPDIGVSWEVDRDRKRITAIRVLSGKSILRVQAFAAPKTSGLWQEARQQLAATITKDGGKVGEVKGTFGPELRAVVPLKGKTSEDGKQLGQRARFVGVDGPRWMLRATIQGEAAQNAEAAARMEEIFAGIVVARGDEPIPPREPLELRLSSQTQELLERARQRAAEQRAGTEAAPESIPEDADPVAPEDKE